MKSDNIMLFVIDPQNDFMDDGALPVAGAKKRYGAAGGVHYCE